MPSTQPSKNSDDAVIGTTLEWYDLSLFGLMVAYFLSIIFPLLISQLIHDFDTPYWVP